MRIFKKTLLSLIILVLGVTGTRAQQRYIPLKEFQGDTVRYMIVNFVENKNRYIGQKVDSLFKDLEFEIITSFMSSCKPMDNYKINGLKFSHHNHRQQVELHKNGEGYYLLYIRFAPPYTATKTLDKWSQIKGVYWNKERRDFMKDYIIKDIELVSYND